MPYAEPYTYVPADSGVAYMYVYYPAAGWAWVYAPWVLGIGPGAYWGPHGRAYFAWYTRPWFRPYHRGPIMRGTARRPAVPRRPVGEDGHGRR